MATRDGIRRIERRSIAFFLNRMDAIRQIINSIFSGIASSPATDRQPKKLPSKKWVVYYTRAKTLGKYCMTPCNSWVSRWIRRCEKKVKAWCLPDKPASSDIFFVVWRPKGIMVSRAQASTQGLRLQGTRRRMVFLE